MFRDDNLATSIDVLFYNLTNRTATPASAAGAFGGRTIRQSARAMVASMELSCTS
jgi:hypothetical protein